MLGIGNSEEGRSFGRGKACTLIIYILKLSLIYMLVGSDSLDCVFLLACVFLDWGCHGLVEDLGWTGMPFFDIGFESLIEP